MSEYTCEVIKTPEEYEKYCMEKYNTAVREDWEPTQRLYWLGMLSASEAMNDLFRSRWIPVTERLPVNHDEVIISLKGYEKTITASYIATKNFFAGVFHDHPIEEVTAWMPLPEPYKEDKDDTARD